MAEADENGDNGVESRALVPQPHGGALRPFAKGNGPGSGGAARRSSMRGSRKMARELLKAAVPEMTHRLIKLARSPDQRVGFMAVQEALNRGLGKPTENPQTGEEESGFVDISHLGPTDRLALANALATIERLTKHPPSAGALPAPAPTPPGWDWQNVGGGKCP